MAIKEDMRKLIQQLEPQCWEMSEFGLKFNHEKYAEFIINECKIVVAKANNPLGRNIDKLIDMHFGENNASKGMAETPNS